MKICYLLLIFLQRINGKLPDREKIEFCENLECDNSINEKVCGVRDEEDEVIFKLFDNECQLLQYGCQVDDSKTYGIINMEYCSSSTTQTLENIEHVTVTNDCQECSLDKADPVCGIRQDGAGFRIRTFENECQLIQHNCQNKSNFIITDFFICVNEVKPENNQNKTIDEAEHKDNTEPTETTQLTIGAENESIKKIQSQKNIVVVDGSMLDMRNNINESIDNFFAATHVLDLPLKNMQPVLNLTTRRMMIRVFGPVLVFKPWIQIPDNISDDHYHKPTLSSCYHKCPTKCPDTYAPVCGVPGIVAREPSLMFQNHCFMDVAQCKMYWEGKSYTSESSAYIESSFLFCLGDEMNGMYRFLPLVRTLQHMGRLKKKGRFNYKFRNMRFFNNMLMRQPKLMG